MGTLRDKGEELVTIYVRYMGEVLCTYTLLFCPIRKTSNKHYTECPIKTDNA